VIKMMNIGNSKISKLTLAGILAGAGVLLSGIYFPFGPTRCFPFQHTINVISGILLGPWWALGVAFTTSTIRVLTGMGTLFAFPGSIPGAMMVGFAFQMTKKDWAALAEPLGTGPVGATVSALILGPAIGKSAGLLALQGAFLASSIPGSVLGLVFMLALRKTGLIAKKTK
jgi:energy coupling factor transporter S component ThiW